MKLLSDERGAMNRQEAYQMALKLHREQGLGATRIHRIMPEVKDGTIESWIHGWRKPRIEPDLSPFLEVIKKTGTLDRQETYQIIMRFHEQGLSAKWIHKCFPHIPKPTIGSWIYNGFKPNQYSRPKPHLEPDLSSTPELAFILGVLYGDGSVTVYSSTIALMVNDRDFAVSFYDALERIGMFPTFHTGFYLDKNRFIVRAYSKQVAGWFKTLSFDEVENITRNYEVDFVRGFYDSEGTLVRHGETAFRIFLFNTNVLLIQFVQRLITKLGFKSAIRVQPPRKENPKTVYRLDLLGGGNETIKFCQLVQPSIPRKSIIRIEGSR